MMRNRRHPLTATFLLVFSLLVLLDQGVKLVIKAYFFHRQFDLIPPILSFKPHLNVDYSWVNSLFNLGLGRAAHLIVTSLLLVLILVVFDFLKSRLPGRKIIDWMFAFLIGGALCSLLDKLFWGGSLDFIRLNGFFIFDLKDVYINIFLAFAFVLILRYREQVHAFQINELYEHVMGRWGQRR